MHKTLIIILGFTLSNVGSLAAVAADSSIASGAEFMPIAKLIATDAAPNDNFGYSVAISGTTVVAGAWQQNAPGANSGAAYVFERTVGGTAWNPVIKLVPNGGATGDQFGRAVAIDGDWLIAGAQFDDEAGNDRGAAYIFQRTANTWSEVATLTADDSAFRDFFGQAVAISGNHAVVGAPEDDHANGNDSGSVYVFERNSANASWTQVAKLIATDGEGNDMFGSAVAIAGDTVLVGASVHNHLGVNDSGAAYVFQRDSSNGSWSQVAKLTANDADEKDQFGFSVAIAGNLIIIGAPFDRQNNNIEIGGSAYVFGRASGSTSWIQEAKLTATDTAPSDGFGYSVSIAGEKALIGARFDDDSGKESGSAYLFQRNSGANSWSQSEKLVANDGAIDDWFGFSVSLTAEFALIGAHRDDDQGQRDSGSAYIFTVPAIVSGIFGDGFEG